MDKPSQEYLAHQHFCTEEAETILDNLEKNLKSIPEMNIQISHRLLRILNNCNKVGNIQPIYNRIYDILERQSDFPHDTDYNQNKEHYIRTKNTPDMEFHVLTWLVQSYYRMVKNEVYGDIKIDKIIINALFGKEKK